MMKQFGSRPGWKSVDATGNVPSGPSDNRPLPRKSGALPDSTDGLPARRGKSTEWAPDSLHRLEACATGFCEKPIKERRFGTAAALSKRRSLP